VVEPVKGPFRLPVAGALMMSECSMQAFAACTIAAFVRRPLTLCLQGIGPGKFWLVQGRYLICTFCSKVSLAQP